MTFLRRFAARVRRFLRRNSPEFAVLHITRDEATLATSETGQAIMPMDVDAMWKARGDSGRHLRLLVTAWLIAYYEVVHSGQWPEVVPESIPTHGGKFQHGPQEIPGMYACEISTRVRECGPDGLLCWNYYQGGAVILDDSACERINRALRYCSGWRRKRQPYKVWTNHHKREHPISKHNGGT